MQLWAWGASQGEVTKVPWLSTSPAPRSNATEKQKYCQISAMPWIPCWAAGKFWKICLLLDLLIQSHELQPWLRQNSRRLQDLFPGSMTSQPLNQPQTPQIWVFQSPKPSAAKTQAQLTAPQLQGRVRAPSQSLV